MSSQFYKFTAVLGLLTLLTATWMGLQNLGGIDSGVQSFTFSGIQLALLIGALLYIGSAYMLRKLSISFTVYILLTLVVGILMSVPAVWEIAYDSGYPGHNVPKYEFLTNILSIWFLLSLIIMPIWALVRGSKILK